MEREMQKVANRKSNTAGFEVVVASNSGALLGLGAGSKFEVIHAETCGVDLIEVPIRDADRVLPFLPLHRKFHCACLRGR